MLPFFYSEHRTAVFVMWLFLCVGVSVCVKERVVFDLERCFLFSEATGPEATLFLHLHKPACKRTCCGGVF